VPCVARFGSAAWFDDVNASAIAVDPAMSAVVDLRIGDVAYRVSVRDGRLTVGPIEAAAPADATLALDYDTARALATGALNAHHAFLAGRVKVSGNVTGLAVLLPTLAELEPVLAAVRDRTTY
jgi:putative sterol carrier protein